MIHQLKIETNYLKNLVDGLKKSEIRINDRDYQKDDLLQFKDYSITPPREFLFQITHIHSGLGMKEGYVCLSVSQIEGRGVCDEST